MAAGKELLFSKIVGAFAFGLFIVALVHVLDFSTSEELIGAFKKTGEAQGALLHLKDTELLLKDVQRSHRGYVITAQPEFLNPFHEAEKELPKQLEVLEQYFRNKPGQQADINLLGELAAQKVAYVRSSITLVQEGHSEQAMQEVVQGKRLFDQLLLVMDRMQRREEQYINTVREEAAYYAAKNRTVVLIASVASAMLLVFALRRIALEVGNVQALQEKLREANDELSASNEELLTINQVLSENESSLLEARQALELREQQLLEAQAISRTGSFVWNIQENKVSFTQEYARIFRIRTDEPYTFEKFLTRLHPEDRNRVQQVIQESIHHKTPYQLEYRLNFADQPVHLFVNAKPVYDDATNQWHLFGTVADITFLKEAQAEMKAQEERFRALLESAPDAMIIADQQGRISLANLQAEKLFGYTKEALVGRPINLLLPQRYQHLFANYQKAYSKNPDVQKLELGEDLWGVDSKGREFPVEVNFNPIQNREELFFVAAIRDISQRRVAEQRLKEAYQKLEQTNHELKNANAELGTFSYSISHDLRAPLRTISGYSSILKDEYAENLNEEGRKFLEIIRLSANRMGTLIHDLLEFAKFGKKAVHKRNFDMHALILQVLADKSLKTGAAVVVETMEPVWGDPALLRQVWENLISNAIKFTGRQEKPIINISYRRERERQVFCIKDNGIGFDPDYSQEMFQVFKRLHADTAFEGTGAGLAIAKRIIEAHAGKIWASGQTGAGATFCFSLPIAEA
jgi:PAS domain S-box-containing protein